MRTDTVLDVVQAALDRMAEMDPSELSDPESVRCLERMRSQMESVTAGSVAAFDAAGNWEADGARSAQAWLRSECRLSHRQAAAQVRRGRHLRHLPATAGAFARGDITSDHVDVLVAADSPRTGDALVEGEEKLVDEAGHLRHDQFVRLMAYWRQCADPDGTDDDAEQRRARRDVSVVQSFGGMWFGKMTLDPVSGTIVADELSRLEEVFFEVDRAAAEERLGREPSVSDLARTPHQRRADALVEMATRSRSTSPDARRPVPLFTVLVGWETLRGRISQLENGTVVPPGSLLPWLDGADLERADFSEGGRVKIGAPMGLSPVTPTALARAVFGPRVRAEVPPGSRLYTGATRRSIQVRDQECTHPTCDVRAPRCEVDHIQPFSAGGPTTQENGRLLCGFHNRLRNQRPPPDG